MKAITSANVKAFFRYMEKEFDLEILSNKSAPEMQLIRLILSRIGASDEWINKWTFTIGNRIYLSFTPGTGSVDDMKEQIIVLCHEIQHVRQYRQDRAKFIFRYYGSLSRRAHYETNAMHANLEMYYYLYGAVPDPYDIAEGLKDYFVRKTDRQVTAKHLMVYNDSVARGYMATEPAKKARRWWG